MIPTKDREVDLERCLLALRNQSQEADQVIVINNGQSGGVRAVLDRFDEVTVIPDETPCLPRLFNVGWRAAQGEILGFLNDDAEPCRTWVADVRAAFNRLPQAAAVGGPTVDLRDRRMRTLVDSGSVLVSIYDRLLLGGRLESYGVLTSWGAYSIGKQHPSSVKRVDCLTITNMAVARAALEAAGGFDEDFLFTNYDGFFFLRLKELGLPVFAIPGASANHHVGATGSTRSAYFLARDYAVWFRKLGRRGLKEATLTRVGDVASLVFWLRSSWKGDPGLVAQALKGYWAGVWFIHNRRGGDKHPQLVRAGT